MISSIYNGVNIFVLPYAPDWNQAFRVQFDLLADKQTSLSNRESRRAYSETLRLSSKYTLTINGSEARQLDGALRDYQTQPVVFPLWPAVVDWTDRGTAPISAGLKIAFKDDFSQWELYEAVEPSSFVPDAVAPAIWGRMEKRAPKWLDGETIEFTVEHIESSPLAYALAPSASVFAGGPALAGYGTAPVLFPFPIDFDGITRNFDTTVVRDQVGFSRETAETVYPQTNVRSADSQHTFQTASDIASFIEFFRVYGSGASFWMPTWTNAVRLIFDAVATDTVLNVIDTNTIKAGDWLAFMDGCSVIATARVQSKTDHTVTLTAPIGVDLDPDLNQISHLLLCRINRPTATVDWANWDCGQVTISTAEVPAEYAPAADETLGTTIGKLPERCYLYEFSRKLGGGVYFSRYTSHEKDLNYSGNAFTSAKFNHGDLTQSIYIDRDVLEIDSYVFTGNPMNDIAALRSEVPLFLKVYQAEVSGSNATNVTAVFTGEITSASVRGSNIKATAVVAGTIFDRKIPRFRLQPGCNHSIYSPGCGQNKDDWEFTGQIQTAVIAGYPYQITLYNLARVHAGLGMPTFFANWFAGGWMQFGAGNAMQIRPILQSLVVGSNLIINVSRDFNPAPALNAVVSIFPGCDQRSVTCKAFNAVTNPEGKFDNYLNFGGHPFLPTSNPSLVKLSQNIAGGKK